MGRLFYVLGIVFTIAIVGVAGIVGIAIHRGSALDEESKAYIEQAVADVGRDWDRTELLKRASPDLLKKASGEQIETLFQHLRSLGSLVRYDGAKGQAVMSFFVGKGSTVRAHYEANATFKNGSARFRIDLSNHNERWMIDSFFVDIPSFGNGALVKQI